MQRVVRIYYAITVVKVMVELVNNSRKKGAQEYVILLP